MNKPQSMEKGPFETRGLKVWHLYKNPRDYPGYLVVRRGLATPMGYAPDIQPEMLMEDTPENLRRIFGLYSSLHWIPRQDQDEPQVMGCWV